MRFPGLKTLRISDANNCISRAYGRRQLRVASRDVKTSSTGAPGAPGAPALPRGMSILSGLEREEEREKNGWRTRRTEGENAAHESSTVAFKATGEGGRGEEGWGPRSGGAVGWSVVRPRGTAYTAVLFQYFKRTPGHHTYHGRPIFEVREGRGGG